MNTIELEEIKLIGLALKTKTSNENGKSNIDCGNLWQKFETGNYASKISNKVSDEILAVYYAYEGDYTQPFSYFIGCKVKSDEEVPQGMDSLKIPKGNYSKIIASGKMPDCIANAWKKIWDSNIARAYKTDFETYGERSKDWNKAEVEIFVSIK